MRMKIVATALACALIAACGQEAPDSVKQADALLAASSDKSAAAAQAFLAAASAAEGAQVFPSGLVLRFVKRARDQGGVMPVSSSQVTVHYEGSLANGDVFDSSFQRGQPASFSLSGVVPGFSEAITHMRAGDEVIATFPAELGYGANGSPPVIPPASPLQFRIQLLSFRAADGRTITAP